MVDPMTTALRPKAWVIADAQTQGELNALWLERTPNVPNQVTQERPERPKPSLAPASASLSQYRATPSPVHELNDSLTKAYAREPLRLSTAIATFCATSLLWLAIFWLLL